VKTFLIEEYRNRMTNKEETVLPLKSFLSSNQRIDNGKARAVIDEYRSEITDDHLEELDEDSARQTKMKSPSAKGSRFGCDICKRKYGFQGYHRGKTHEPAREKDYKAKSDAYHLRVKEHTSASNESETMARQIEQLTMENKKLKDSQGKESNTKYETWLGTRSKAKGKDASAALHQALSTFANKFEPLSEDDEDDSSNYN
jgi:hypothetical protein